MIIQIVFAHGTGASPEAPFGLDQGLPWNHNSEDLKHFKKVTENSVLIMGGRTFESLPGVLPGRDHYVISTGTPLAKNGKSPHSAFSGDTIEAALKAAIWYAEREGHTKVSIIGGPEIIYAALPYATCVIKSEIHEECDCDVSIDLERIINQFPTIDMFEVVNDTLTIETLI